jgi:hypothetical protein
MRSSLSELDAVLTHLRGLPFVRKLRVLPPRDGDERSDGLLEVTSSGGRYRLVVQHKRAGLNQSLSNSIIGWAESEKTTDRIVLARYVPAAIGEQLIDAGISFADEQGNIHLRLGSEYNWTVFGKKEPRRLPEAIRTTPATLQLLFLFATNPEAASWTVRDLASATGISKSKAAQLRNQFLTEGLLTARSGFQLTPEVTDRMISGYSQILRPKLVIGRYRSPDDSAERFLQRLVSTAKSESLRYALTGGPAAAAMQHFYQGSDIPVFMSQPGNAGQRALRLLPDRTGPVLLLEPFGDLIYWQEFDGMMVAPPWLVYAELLVSGDPRAREAAEELRRGFLQ